MRVWYIGMLPACFGFHRPFCVRRHTCMQVYPTEIMNGGEQGLGELWSYTTLQDRVKEIDSVSLFRSNNEITGLVVWSQNELHRIQYISELK